MAKLYLVLVAILLSACVMAEPYYEGMNTRTICSSNDMLEMKSQLEDMKKMGRPIGKLTAGGSACTGTLIERDLFLTARHCNFGCSGTKVTFGYLGSQVSGQETFKCKEVVEVGNSNSNQDYMVMRLEGNPGVNWGWYNISDREISKDTPLLMIHHPGGTPMKVSNKNCQFKKENGGLFYHSCDTNPGSSGSSVIIPDYEKPERSRIVAVHTLGGCNSSSSSFNAGPSIRGLVKISPTLKAMAQ